MAFVSEHKVLGLVYESFQVISMLHFPPWTMHSIPSLHAAGKGNNFLVGMDRLAQRHETIKVIFEAGLSRLLFTP